MLHLLLRKEEEETAQGARETQLVEELVQNVDQVVESLRADRLDTMRAEDLAQRTICSFQYIPASVEVDVRRSLTNATEQFLIGTRGGSCQLAKDRRRRLLTEEFEGTGRRISSNESAFG